MAGFSDPIVGGIGNLIRQYIRSPNFVTGVSGWTINKDGSAEFNNLIIRGTIELAPIAGGTAGSIWWNDSRITHGLVYMDLNEVLHMASGFNVGKFGGRVSVSPDQGAGVGDGSNYVLLDTPGSLRANMVAILLADQFSISDNSGLGHPKIQLAGASGLGDTTQIILAGAGLTVFGGVVVDLGANPVTLDPGGVLTLASGSQWKLGAGSQGKYYHEEYTTASLAIPNSAVTLVLYAGGASSHLQTDYNGGASSFAPSGGALTFTAPEDGIYTFVFRNGGIGTTLGAAVRFQMNITTLGVVHDYASFTGQQIISETAFVAKNTTIQFQFFQLSGSARNVTFFVTAHRHI